MLYTDALKQPLLFSFSGVSGLNIWTYKNPFENLYSFVKQFVKLHQFPMLFHQENASEKYQFINSSGKIYLHLFPLQFSSIVSVFSNAFWCDIP